MILRTRRIIYLAFILVFILITPVIILYATGYRYNFQKHRFQKTGILIIKSEPSGANIYLNGGVQKNTTPARIADLIPENYLIEVGKDGYHSWQKNLPVASNLTTFAENITLFGNNLPIVLIDGDVSYLTASPDYGKLAYVLSGEDGDEAWIFDLKNSKRDLLYKTSAGEIFSSARLQWSRDSQKIIISIVEKTGKNKYVIFDNRTKSAETYGDLNDFYFEFSGVKNNSLGLAASKSMVFLPGPSNLLAVLNPEIQDLKIWNTGSGDLIFETEADSAAWLDGGSKLLYANNFEIWFYDVASEKETLVTRYSKEIKAVAWINANYIAAIFDNTLKTIELDERDQRNVTDLATIDSMNGLNVDPKGKKIYFTGTLGNQKGVFELLY